MKLWNWEAIMKTRLSIFGLVLMLLFGAAIKSAADKTNNHGAAPGNAASPGGDLKLGEYACYGSGGQLLIGLGFKVLSGNRYTDLDNKEHGTFTIKDDTITFHGGHLDGEVGQNLKDYKFTIHSASCEPFK